jgi:hypothetical protein
MKSKLSTIALLFFIGMMNAQDITSKKGENYLPETDDWSIAFNINNVFRFLGNSFNGNFNNASPSLDFVEQNNSNIGLIPLEGIQLVNNSGTFVGKKMLADNKAFRMLANFNFSTTNFDYRVESEDEEPQELNLKYNAFALSVGVGKEWRKGSTRLQGFYGGDVLLNLNSAEVDYGNEGLKLKQGLGGGLGVNGFIGAEYFLFPKMAVGVQYTYNVSANLFGKIELNDDDSKQEVSGNAISIGGVGISSFNLSL